MKKWSMAFLMAATFCFAQASYAADVKTTKLATVNFKKCVEDSKIGKQEQASFEAMKKQMENVVVEKEKTLNEMATKLNDPDQLDLMSPEAETELKRKFRALSQELAQIQQQYYQALNQANFKIVQELSETVAKASEQVAKDLKLDVVFNDETTFYTNPELDISSKVVVEMDKIFDNEKLSTPATKK